MKTSKRKRSSKADPAVAAVDAASAPDAAVSVDPAVAEVIAVEAAIEAPVAQAHVAESDPVVAEVTMQDPVVVLAANCSVKDAAALKTSLCAVAAQSVAVTLDASAVERVDTATMQLLCAFARDRGSRNQSIVWRGKSQALHDAVRLLGVGALLGFDDAKGVAA
ncbi:MAG: STAS domain-containing protein [Steroidobacter sp.]